MKVYILLGESNHCPYETWVVGAYANESAARATHRDAVERALADGARVYWNPMTEEHTDDWDVDYKVEEHEVTE
jgi:hypothetical protein